MEQLPSISIITPSLNQAGFIERTITSVLTQNYPNLEYYVIDGGSTDGTINILQKSGNSLHWISEPDRGQANAINKGLRLVKGDIICYLNSDDELAPGSLRIVGEFFRQHLKAAWLTGRCKTINQQGEEVRRIITGYKDLWLHLRSHKVLLILNYISQPSTFWRRTIMNEVGLFDENLHYVMDYDYWLRIYRRYPVWTVPSILAYFRIHSASKSGSTSHAQFEEEFDVARRYTRSNILLRLHQLHKSFAIQVYRRMNKIEQ